MGRTWFALFAIGCVTAGTTLDDTGASDDTSGDTDETELDTGVYAEIVVTPEQITWSGVGPGCTEDKTLTVSNVGGYPLRVSSITIGPSPTFEVAGDFPTDVQPEGEATFAIRFTPAAATEYSGSLRVFSDAPGDDDEILVPLTGVGVAPTVTDTFTQGVAGKVDILWVLDTSSSMGGVAVELEAQVDEYVEALFAAGADFHLAVTTVDMDTVQPGNQGTLMGDPLVWTSEMTVGALVDAFDDAVNPAASGSSVEKALAAAYAALQTPGHAVTAGLVRSDARLVVLLIGDEDDQSGQTGAWYADWIEAYKSSARLARIDALVPMAGGTNPFALDHCIDLDGTPVIDAAVAGSGGHAESLCEDDLGGAMGRLGTAAAGLSAWFVLTTEPSSGPVGMTVTVDGDAVTFDPFRAEGWAYDEQAGAVALFGSAIPAPGEDVVVTYPVDATCP